VAVAIFSLLHLAALKAEGLFFPPVEKWTTTLESPPSFPAAFDETQAYVARRDNQLVALSLQTGKPAWSVECPMTAAPVAGDASVFSGRDGTVEARAQLDGKLRWQSAVEGRIDSLYWDTGWLIATTDKGAVLAMRAADGEVLWHRDLGAGLQAAPAPAADRLYLPLKNGAVMALDLKTGEPLWTVQLEQPASGILALADRLYVGSLDKKFYCLSADKGHVQWSWKTGAAVVGVAAIDAKRVYFVSLDNVLRALDRNNGSMLWGRSMTTRPSAGPLLKGWMLIVPSITSELHAFLAPTGTPAPAGDFVLLSPQNQEMQFIGPPHLTSDDVLITMTKGGVMQAFVGSPSPYGP
jgi:outer membrane protein assembly factor BamB